MARSLPSIIGRQTGRAAGAAVKGTLNLGSASFNRMFPTIGRLMGGQKKLFDARPAMAATSASLVRNNASLGVIYDNINEQNRLLENLLNSYKYGTTGLPGSAAAGGGGAGGIDIDPVIPELERGRPRPTPQQRPGRPRSGPRRWLRRFLTFMKRRSPRLFRAAARRIAVAAAGVAVPGPGWIVAFISAMGTVAIAYDIYLLYREFQQSGSEEEDEDIENNLPSEQESEEEERRLREEAEQQNYGDVSQMGVQEGEEVQEGRVVREMQEQQAQARRNEAGLAANLEDTRRQGIMQRLAVAERNLARADTNAHRRAVENIRGELTRYNIDHPPSQRDAAIIGGSMGSSMDAETGFMEDASRRAATRNLVGQSMASEMEFFYSAEDRGRERGSVGASMDAETSFMEDASRRAATRNLVGQSMASEMSFVHEDRGRERGSMGSSMDAETSFMEDASRAEDRGRERGSVGASMDAETSFVHQAIQRSADAIRVEGDTIIYDFEQIKFEAQKIKFEGLSLPSQQTAAPMAQEAATPQMTMASAPASSATRITGPQPLQVNNQSMITPGGGSAPQQAGYGMQAQGGEQAGAPGSGSAPQQAGYGMQAQGGGQAGVPGSASAAMQFFQSRGWSPAQAAGLAANIQVESNFNPAAVGDSGRAYGIGQWHPPRQMNFQAWAGRDIRGSTFEQQLEFMHYEMTQGTERRAGSIIRQATTPEQAAALVDQHYERSNGQARGRRMQLAVSYAAGAPAATGQFANNPASSAPVLAQASTERIQADREQIRNTQRMLREFNQQSNISTEQLRQQEASRIAEKKETVAGEVPLRTRILNVFNQLAQAS